jgi:hypothetical protein
MSAAPFDTLKLARALRDKAGFTQEHAEAAADALAEVVVDQVATRQDIIELRTELRAEIAELRTELRAEIAELRSEVRAEIADVRAEIAALRTEVRNEIAALRTEMVAGFRDVEQRMTIRLGGMLVVITGILLAAKSFG